MQRHQCCSVGCGCVCKSEVTGHFAIRMSFSCALSPLSKVNQVTMRKTLTAKAEHQSVPYNLLATPPPPQVHNLMYGHSCTCALRKGVGGVEVQFHSFLIMVLGGSQWSGPGPGRFSFAKRIPSAHLIGGKCKGNIAPFQAMKAYRWSRGTAPLILRPNLGTR